MKADAQPEAPGDARSAVALKLRWSLLAALAGGLLLAASFPPAGIWPLAITGPALLAVALSGRSLRASFCVGLVFGVAFFFPLLSWVLNVAWYAWLALAGASAVIVAVFSIGQRVLLRVKGWPVAVAGWWVALEAFRDRWPWGGFPWGRLAMSQAGAPTAGWAALGGAPFLTFVVALAGAMLAWLLLAGSSGGWRTTRTVLAAVAFAASAGLAVVPALLPLDPVSQHDPTAEVAAIQGDVPQGHSLTSQVNDAEVTANHAAATIALANQVRDHKSPKPDLVIWPENSTDLDPSLYPPIYDELATATDTIDTPLLAGEVLQNPERNVGQLWLPGVGPTSQIYVKRQLVPFGEYLPFRGIVSKISSLTSLLPDNFTPGHKVVVFHVNTIRLGDVICYEVGFDNLVRSEVNAGANLLTEQTNDATFEWDGQTGETGQQLDMARIRAVESDRAVVVASTTGYSAIIAPDGQLIEKTGTWRRAILEARVPLVTYTTLADRVGPWPEYVITMLTAAAFVVTAAAALYPTLRRKVTRSVPADS